MTNFSWPSVRLVIAASRILRSWVVRKGSILTRLIAVIAAASLAIAALPAMHALGHTAGSGQFADIGKVAATTVNVATALIHGLPGIALLLASIALLLEVAGRLIDEGRPLGRLRRMAMSLMCTASACGIAAAFIEMTARTGPMIA